MQDNELPPETGEQLDAAAADWVARIDRAPLDATATEELEKWLATSSRHRGAYMRAQTALAYLDLNTTDTTHEALSAFFVERDSSLAGTARSVSRRRLMWLGGGVAVAAAASLGVIMLNKPDVPVIIYTAKRGEILRVPLVDGSLITLDTASRVAVKYLHDSRNIELLEGRASFDVAKDKTRPFIVMAAGLRVQAVGTSFVVRNTEARPPEVLVREGIVDVGPHTENTPVRVGANTRVIASVAGPALNVVSVDPTAIAHELAWEQGILEYEDVSLKTIAEEYARYSDTRIIIPDAATAARTISGRFSANNPTSFARAAALSFGLKLDVKGQEIRLLQP